MRTFLGNLRLGGWVSASPTSGTLPSGGSTQVAVRLDTAGLRPGSYLTDLLLLSNDPARRRVSVPLALTVEE